MVWSIVEGENLLFLRHPDVHSHVWVNPPASWPGYPGTLIFDEPLATP